MAKGKIRFLFMFIVGVIIFYILNNIVKYEIENHHKIWDFVTCIVITVFVWEGNILLDNWLNKTIQWQDLLRKRIFVQLFLSTSYTVAIIYLSLILFNLYICEYPVEKQKDSLVVSLIIGSMTALIINSIDIGAQFFGHWKKSLVEIERYKTETAQMQLQNLKNQINPHFLFNNLSVLTSLVYENQDRAVDFINQLSKVYRYILENKDIELATIESEMTFIKSYIFLLQIRFDKNIEFIISIDPSKNSFLVPPLTIQLLVENAIKHNEISSESPLKIEIKEKDNFIEVVNNLQLRMNYEPSSKTGLQNIKDRYSFFTSSQIVVSQTEKTFSVKIPILELK
jgi:sensor histidine kinase YesM